MRLERELMRGAGPLAVLKLLERGEMYGYELVEALADRSEGVLAMGQSTLYPMLYNLEARGEVRSTRRRAANGRERKYYALTARGARRLRAEAEQWSALARAMALLGIAPRPAADSVRSAPA
jgi:PadR family transcriptional regulator PadR